MIRFLIVAVALAALALCPAGDAQAFNGVSGFAATCGGYGGGVQTLGFGGYVPVNNFGVTGFGYSNAAFANQALINTLAFQNSHVFASPRVFVNGGSRVFVTRPSVFVRGGFGGSRVFVNSRGFGGRGNVVVNVGGSRFGLFGRRR